MPQYRDEGHKTINGKRYTESGYSNTKAGAQKKAAEVRARYGNMSVRIVKDKNQYVVWGRKENKNA